MPSNPNALLTRWRQTAAVVPSTPDSLSTMLLFGGENIVGATATTLADLWKLEWVATPIPGHWQWSNLTASSTGDIPTARSGHSAFWDSPNNRMVLYGGQDAAGAVTDNNVYVLRVPGGVPTWKRAPVKSGSPVPGARARHAMTANPKPGISTGVVFGGQTAAGLSSELWEFTVHPATDSVTWFLRAAGGTGPAARTDAAIIGYELYPTSYVLLGGTLVGGAGDTTPWEYRFGSGWNALATGAPTLKGTTAIREERVLTALQPEVFDPATNTWTAFGQNKFRTSYHMNFLASDGRFYSPGPNFFGKDSTWRFDPALGTWSLYAVNNGAPLDGTIGGILYRPDQIMKCSGLGLFERGATKSLLTGLTPLTAPWRNGVNAMGRARQNQILSMLRTGEVIATGGQGLADNGNSDPDDDLPCKSPEIWDPNFAQGASIGYWYGADTTIASGLLAPEPVTRGYHSSTVLLPDGRLISGGGLDEHPATVFRSVDQYSPPYLFRPDGSAAFRPRLKGAQDHITWDQDFKVTCPDAVVSACLIRPGAATHAFNQDCRYVPLNIVSQTAHRITLHSPPNANHAPPGNYLLFVLRDESGRKVPSIARWVNVGSTQTTYATWDTLPPAVIGDLQVTAMTASTQTLQWSAPADAGDNSNGKATRYELRFRAAASLGTLDEFFESGRPLTGLPVPGTAGALQTYTVTGLSPDSVYFFRLISRDGAGSDRNWSAMSNEAVTPLGGGCPFVDTRTAGEWAVENSILGRSLNGALALDSYRLRYAPDVMDGRAHLRVRENEQEITTLDQLRLIAIDHAQGVRAYGVGDQVVLGTRTAAARVTTTAGADVTAQVDGSGVGFAGGPGDTLYVEFSAGAALLAASEKATMSHDPFLIHDGGKCPPDCGSPLALSGR